MEVRSHPGERHRGNSQNCSCSRAGGCSCLLCAEKELWQALSPRPWAGDYDTHGLPPRQRSWPSLGCNQQDPCEASERLATACLPWLSDCFITYIFRFRLPFLTLVGIGSICPSLFVSMPNDYGKNKEKLTANPVRRRVVLQLASEFDLPVCNTGILAVAKTVKYCAEITAIQKLAANPCGAV